MSTSSRSDSDTSSSSLDLEELLNIGARCSELRKEKDLLKSSQSQSYGLIKRLEFHVKRLNEAHSEDKRYIQELETKLRNYYDEMEPLQDQLNSRNAEIDSLGKHVHCLDLKLAKIGSLQAEVIRKSEELNQSKLEVLYLKEEVERKELEMKNSTIYIEKLEDTISSTALESQCEIESLRLEMLSLEQRSLESKRLEKEDVQEKVVTRDLIDQLTTQNEEAHVIIETLEEENIEMSYMLGASQTQVKLFVERVEEHFQVLLENVKHVQGNLTSYFGQHNSEVSMCGEILGPLLSKLLSLETFNLSPMEFEEMSDRIHDYEFLVKKLKEEVKEEKLKAKEETEDLAQEMAELRYQMRELLEEERKRRACVEQASLQRIAELEKQLQIERRKAVASIRQMD